MAELRAETLVRDIASGGGVYVAGFHSRTDRIDRSLLRRQDDFIDLAESVGGRAERQRSRAIAVIELAFGAPVDEQNRLVADWSVPRNGMGMSRLGTCRRNR